MAILISLVVIFIIVCVLIIVFKISSKRKENKRIRSYMSLMDELYIGIQKRIDATRRYRHDLARHIQTLEVLLEKKIDEAEISDYVKYQKQQYNKLKSHIVYNDEILDVILNIKKDECENKKIPLTYSIDNGCCEQIEEIDKVSLLLNLLDNAIEASERIPQGQNKGINFSMKLDGKKTIIEIKNHIKRGSRITFITQKIDKDYHGIGTKIIEDLINKYNGTREVIQDDQQWMLSDRIVL